MCVRATVFNLWRFLSLNLAAVPRARNLLLFLGLFLAPRTLVLLGLFSVRFGLFGLVLAWIRADPHPRREGGTFQNGEHVCKRVTTSVLRCIFLYTGWAHRAAPRSIVRRSGSAQRLYVMMVFGFFSLKLQRTSVPRKTEGTKWSAVSSQQVGVAHEAALPTILATERAQLCIFSRLFGSDVMSSLLHSTVQNKSPSRISSADLGI